MIRVIYKNGEEDLVTPKFLDILLHLNEIDTFQRAGDWVNVCQAPLRGRSQGSYSGKERRRHHHSVLQPFAMQNQPSQHSE
ncbi:MAG: hypothetical protein C0619_04030 [Desulfuromonas sp.]|nr:MAG: hypothetical protein C0619_04030 [Desulfuromonas sp.]